MIKYCMVSLICGIKKKKSTYINRVEKWLPGAGGGENRERFVKGTNFQL